MDLSESEQPEDSEDFGVEFVDTSDPDDECEFGLCRDVDLSSEFGLS